MKSFDTLMIQSAVSSAICPPRDATSYARLRVTFLLALVLFISAAKCYAFPLDPARIFARDVSPTVGNVEVEATVWQGGDAAALDDGKRIYVEKRTVQTDPEGRFDFWLGEGQITEGKLAGEDFALDKQLRLQLRYRSTGATEFTNKRFVLEPIDDAYIASSPESHKQLSRDRAAGIKYYKTYEPKFSEFSPELARRGMAILYPDGRLQTEDGSFVETTGTTTSGVQEFFDYCTNRGVDGYIVGGALPHSQQIVYRIWTPLTIHPAQGIRIDTGAIGLQFMPELGEANGLTIDSCMMNDIRIRGILHYMGKGYALAIKPTRPLPLDRFVGNTVVDTIVYVTSIASGGKGAVLFEGSINFNRFEFNEINCSDIGIHVINGSFSANCITCKHVHGQRETSILDECGVSNVWEVSVNCDAMDPLGIVTEGRDSIWFAGVRSRTKPGITLLPGAQGNQFFLMGLNGGYDNQARVPTNRFYATPSIESDKLRLGFAAETPPVPASGELVTNRNPFPVIVMIKSPGSVSSWHVCDTYGAVEEFTGPLSAGQTIYLAVGEGMRLHYDGAPLDWRWRCVQ